MGEMRDRSRFLAELKAKLASETSEEMLARIEAEEAIEDILLELSDSHGFRIVEDHRYTRREEEEGTDFILQIEDFELRLLIRYSASGIPTLSADDLKAMRDILKSSQGTIALAVAWAAPDLPTLIITQGCIEYLLAEEHRVTDFVKLARPLRDAVLRFARGQTKDWELRRADKSPAEEMLPETQAILERKLQEELELESARPYRLERKVAAQKAIRSGDVGTMARVFDEARRASKDARQIANDLERLIDNWCGGEDA